MTLCAMKACKPSNDLKLQFRSDRPKVGGNVTWLNVQISYVLGVGIFLPHGSSIKPLAVDLSISWSHSSLIIRS